MTVLSIANQKGGVGKTTTAINLSSTLAEAGKRVLLIDLDPQANATTSLGFNRNEVSISLYEVLLEGISACSAVIPTALDNLYLLPANSNLPGAEVELVDREDRAYLLKRAVDSLASTYDYIIIDSPPSLGLLTLNGFVAADGLIIAMQAEFLALEGLSQLMNTVELVRERLNPCLEIIGVVLTMYDGRTRLTREVEDSLRQYFEGSRTIVFETTIPRSVRLAEAPSHGLPINLYAPGSSGTEAYRNLAAEVIHATEASIGEGAGRPDYEDPIKATDQTTDPPAGNVTEYSGIDRGNRSAFGDLGDGTSDIRDQAQP
jgi:chromosome partitioning protein